MLINKVKAVVVSLVVVSSFSFSVSQAAEFRAFCDKLKMCLVDNMKAQGAYQAGMEQFFDSMLEQTCDQGLAQYKLIEEKSQNDAVLKEKSDACLASFLEVDCSTMMTDLQQGNSVTPECKDAEAYSKEKGYLDDKGMVKK